MDKYFCSECRTEISLDDWKLLKSCNDCYLKTFKKSDDIEEDELEYI